MGSERTSFICLLPFSRVLSAFFSPIISFKIIANISIEANITIFFSPRIVAKNPAIITLKDHKPNFRSSLPCRLINPSKSELGKVSKVLLENINKQLVELLNVNQWKNSESVIDWFNTIENKHQCVFIQLDIVVIKIFKDVAFKIDIKTNLKVVDFLDVTFNLSNGKYKP